MVRNEEYRASASLVFRMTPELIKEAEEGLKKASVKCSPEDAELILKIRKGFAEREARLDAKKRRQLKEMHEVSTLYHYAVLDYLTKFGSQLLGKGWKFSYSEIDDLTKGVDILCQHEASKAAFAIDLKITEENLFEAFTKIAKSIDKTMKDKGLTTVQYPSDGNSRSLVPRVVVGAGVHGVRGFLQAWKENARTLKTGVHPLGFVQHPAMKMMLLQIKEQLDLQKQLAEKRVYTQAVEAISATKAALSNAMPVSKSEFVENPEAGGKIPLDTLMGLDHVSKTIKEQAAFTLRDGLGS